MPRKRSSPSQRYHDRVAGKYDAIYDADDPYWAFYDRITWQRIRPLLPPDQTAPVVDLGCGTGKWGLRLLKSGYTVHFVDISPKMLDQVTRKADELGRQTSAHTTRADICDLAELPHATFSLALALGEPLSICRDPARALREIHRILAPHALLIATVDNKWAGLDYYLEKADLDTLEQFIKTGKTRWLTKRPDEQFEITMFAPADLLDLLDRAGFDLVDLIGKTVLDVRRHKAILDTPAALRRLVALESKIHRDPNALGRASHLQFAAKKRA